jgi:hypothetical protein
MYWNYHVNARLAAVVTYPDDPDGLEIEVPFDESITRGQLNNNQLSCLEPIDTATFVNLLERDSIAEARSFDQGDRTYTVFVPYNANTPATLEMELRTCVNMRAAQLDINVVNPHSAAEFQHTASLLSVQVLDANMQPVTVPYELISGQGWTYPVQQVPEPSSILTVIVGAVAVAAVSRHKWQRSKAKQTA